MKDQPSPQLRLAVSQLQSMAEVVEHLADETLGTTAPSASRYGQAFALSATLHATVDRAHNDTAILQAVKLDVLHMMRSLEVNPRCFEPAQLSDGFISALQALPLVTASATDDDGDMPMVDMEAEIGTFSNVYYAVHLHCRLATSQCICCIADGLLSPSPLCHYGWLHLMPHLLCKLAPETLN